MFAALNELIERRIDEARRQGAFDDLPGSGRPLELDDDGLVPEDLRVAYRILKNAGFVPPEVEALRDVDALLGKALDQDRAQDAARGEGDGRRARRLVAMAIALEQRGAQRRAFR